MTTPRRCRCHFCERVRFGRFLPFTDGRRRWVCDSCREQQEMDVAQEEDQAAAISAAED